VAIIVLTIIIKVILFPLTRKGQISMYHLQKLTPRIKALQEQYKNDKQKLAVEQMKLWKEYGVNPLSGCLPMFFQIPVFFGLYWALALAIELRQAPFMLWITDLSQPDQLFKLPGPVLGATHLHLLPLLMTASWLVQSLTQPKSPDPQTRQQQKIMAFMPLIFLFFFYNVPSGLTLYWFTSTLLGIVEQQLIKKFYLK
jgi:YidC/Oxa1 family membrane protein insertase